PYTCYSCEVTQTILSARVIGQAGLPAPRRCAPETLEMRTSIRDNRNPREQSMKQAKDIMSGNPACCTPEHDVQQAGEMMVKHDCGEIPVVENDDNMKPIGVITDRDIRSAWWPLSKTRNKPDCAKTCHVRR